MSKNCLKCDRNPERSWNQVNMRHVLLKFSLPDNVLTVSVLVSVHTVHETSLDSTTDSL